MKMNMSINALLEHLQSRDECHRIEAKASHTILGKSARETISAFSNEPDLGGGYLLLGLERNNNDSIEARYSLRGVDDPDKIQCELASACREEFNVRISPEIRVECIEGKALVVAFIPESFVRDKPVFIKKYGVDKGAFRRIGSSDHRCTAHDLDLLYQLRSGIPYESEVLSDVSWEDIDLEAVSAYRRQRAQVDPEAVELGLDDMDLLFSLRCLVHRNGLIVPNVAGLVLFGSKAALRRLLPTDARVDYVITEGPEWIGDPSARHYSTEYRESLVTLLPRLHAQIMGDLPKLFGLESGQLQRTDTPTIPRDVIREALSNALMHRDYRAGQPTLVIRYSNRLEFKNAGYSLKPFEDLGKPGSRQRNSIIAAVFHELKYAESKGTGIGSMKEWMLKAGLTTPPIIETDRDSNEFDLVLLPHHLLDKHDLAWLAHFSTVKLSDAERRALVLAREMGAITNQDYRQINGTDTLTASKALVHLRDLGLLSMKGSGNGTYYVLSEDKTTPQISPKPEGLTPQISPKPEGLTPQISPLCRGIDALPKNFPTLPEDLRNELESLGKKVKKKVFKDLIKRLCSLGPLQLSQLAMIFDREPRYIRDDFLTEMIRDGDLVYLYPDTPAHPKQAYKAPNKNGK
ncbi:MAG: hypothetical protein S4CHLAM2_18750 [Chlamydiales bacterium]|nr:hypothetical protein [Chlamydiales bacterium]